jgi:NADH/F420H2 dehydrogenase subunit C
MSDATNENEKPQGSPKAPPPKKEEAPPPPPPEHGPVGRFLESRGNHCTALGLDAGGMEMIDVPAAELRDVCFALRDDNETRFDLLVSLSGVDQKEYRQVVYHLYATSTGRRVALKAKAEGDKLPSVVPVWAGANWHEREAYDLFGIVFEGHPDLRRILMPEDWTGYPLRKDYVVDDPRLVWNER